MVDNNTKPWADVCFHWEKSYPLRNVKMQKKINKVSDIYNDWPVLKTALGYSLVSIHNVHN